jgi:ribonuclease HII
MKKAQYIIGIDEVGRGPLAGPVYVCACMMKSSDYKKWKPIGLTDSKKMTEKAREVWFKKAKELKREGKVYFTIGKASAKTIDSIGITKAISKCISSALNRLIIINSRDSTDRLYVVLDGGLKAPKQWVHQQTIIKGDESEKIISLASVIAKVFRDRCMVGLCKKHPQFCWDQNKGYGTKVHRSAIQKNELTTYHRKSYLTKVKYPVE